MNKLCARRFINNLKSIAKGLASAGLNSARIPQIRLHVNIKILFRNAALPRLCPDKAEEGRRKEEGGRRKAERDSEPGPITQALAEGQRGRGTDDRRRKGRYP
jgi:hypothetical protein